jgi:ClpP class serine protease
MVTDGRVVSGRDAVKLGLIDQVGDLDAAIGKAKELAHIQRAKIIVFTRTDDNRGSIYASSPTNVQPQVNMINLNVDLGDLIPHGQSQFLYLWTGFGNE